MELTIRTHHTKAVDGFQEHAEKKLARLERFLPRIDSVVIEIEHEETKAAADRYVLHVTVHAGGTVLRTTERASDPRTAMETAADVLTQQARREKERIDSRRHPKAPDGQSAKEIVADRLNSPPPDADQA